MIFLISSCITGLTIFRVIERLGEGYRGYAFGVDKELKKTGAVLGPLIVYGLLRWLRDGTDTDHILFWVALALI